MAHKDAKTRTKWGRGAESRPAGLDFTMLLRAEAAVEELIRCHGFWEGSREQFAIKMGWPNRRTVETVQRLTQDQDMYPLALERLAGFRISYAPSKGGVLLIAPDGDLPLDHGLHFLAGDLQRQQAEKTILRRRIPSWRAIGDQAGNAGDLELARICYQAMNELERQGFVTDHITNEFFKALATRGVAE
jgi:hypothetical protein